MNTRKAVLAAVILLATALCAQAQQLEVAVKPSDYSFTATPPPTPAVSPSVQPAKPFPTPPEAKKEEKEKEQKAPPATQTDYSWIARWVGIAVVFILLFFAGRWLLRTFKSWQENKKTVDDLKETDTTHKPAQGHEHHRSDDLDDYGRPKAPRGFEHQEPAPLPTPSRIHAKVSTAPPATTEIEIVPPPATPAETTVIEGKDVPPLEDLVSPAEPEAPNPADDTDPKGSVPKAATILILALGLSFAQAGMASAQCKIDEIKTGQKIVQEQAPIFVEIQTSGCKNPTGLGIRASGFEITRFKFHPDNGRITALVSADATSEKGKLEFKIFDGMEVRSTDKVFFTVYPSYAALLHNDVDHVKTSVTNLTGELRKGVATLNGRVDGLKTETDKVRAEVKAKADSQRTQTEIDQLKVENDQLKSTVDKMRSELDEAKKAVSGMSKSIYDNTVAVSNAFELIGGLASQERAKGGLKGLFGGKETTNNPISITAERLRKLNATRAAAIKKAKAEVSEYDDSER